MKNKETKEERLTRLLREFSEAAAYAYVIKQTWEGASPLYDTREQWLMEMYKLFKVFFVKQGHPLNGRIRLSCGWARGRKAIVGQCWSQTMSKDGTTEIFISPNVDDPIEVTSILIHELIHAAIGNEHAHGSTFRKCAISVGLMGKMTATISSPPLIHRIANCFDTLGGYPHATLNDIAQKKQTTRLIKADCPYCGYTIRITRQWIDKSGLPHCPNLDCEQVLKESV